MTHRIRRIGVLKAGVMGAAVYAIMSLVFVPFFFFVAIMPGASGMQEGWPFGAAFVLLLPFLYAIFGFIGTALAALIYNLVAMMVGGLEVELESIASAPAAPPTPGY